MIAGGTCKDGSSISPQVNGSTWQITSGVWSLTGCPPGYYLHSQQCVLCKPLTYSIVPLTLLPDSLTESAPCLTCPAGCDCTAGGADIRCEVGTWIAVNGSYILTGCPAGHQLVNSTVGTSRGAFSSDLQQCKACIRGQYIINPDTDVCQDCPPGLLFLIF